MTLSVSWIIQERKYSHEKEPSQRVKKTRRKVSLKSLPEVCLSKRVPPLLAIKDASTGPGRDPEVRSTKWWAYQGGCSIVSGQGPGPGPAPRRGTWDSGLNPFQRKTRRMPWL